MFSLFLLSSHLFFRTSSSYSFSAMQHYILEDCNSHRQSCEIFWSHSFIFSGYSSSYIHLFLSLYYSASPLSFFFLIFPSSLSPPFTPIILPFLLLLPFPFYSFYAASPSYLSSSPSTSFEPTALVIHLPKLSSFVWSKSCNLCFSFCTFLESDSIDPYLLSPSHFSLPSHFIKR